MDLAVRASLKGWKFLYLSNVQVKCELPSTLKAYRYQQHRWSCGPANLFRKVVMEILTNKKVSLWKKFHVVYNFFFVKKIVVHINTFVFYCIVLPATVMVPEVAVPKWSCVYIPCIMTLLKSVGTPRSFYLLVFWVLFENTMSLHRTKATIIGLLETSRVNEWVVTEKLGDALKDKVGGLKVLKKHQFSIGDSASEEVLEEEMASVYMDTAHNNTRTADRDMSELVSYSEDELVAETQIILQQPALPQVVLYDMEKIKKKHGQLERERVSIPNKRILLRHTLNDSFMGVLEWNREVLASRILLGFT
ncbi:hypothetical protein TSUD_22830 [Trifolium subterraneum]|uniref:Glycosyltransferase 2-like domain-containing protein n=1 Tax=Trifolium subterraneum TaxID=3900 RepID=A0A2Z6P612_TRISU|nr:hypothetical protein TSUD_22830 [Trifolium subterraneum]